MSKTTTKPKAAPVIAMQLKAIGSTDANGRFHMAFGYQMPMKASEEFPVSSLVMPVIRDLAALEALTADRPEHIVTKEAIVDLISRMRGGEMSVHETVTQWWRCDSCGHSVPRGYDTISWLGAEPTDEHTFHICGRPEFVTWLNRLCDLFDEAKARQKT